MEPEPAGVVLSYAYRDTDRTGQIRAEARFGDFAGVSTAWFGDDDLLGFADELLDSYPLRDRKIEIAGGYLGPTQEIHVGLVVHSLGQRGQLGIVAHLRAPGDHQPEGWPPAEARVVVPTSYEAVQRFAAEIRLLVNGAAAEARLEAEILG